MVPFDMIDENSSYLEHCYPGFAQSIKAQGINYAEIGRTFVMPAYQKRQWLLQLIRAFVCVPESIGIRHAFGMISFNQESCSKDCGELFLLMLKNWLGSDPIMPVVPATQFPIELRNISLTHQALNKHTFSEVVDYLQSYDPNFAMPPVLGPYLSLCPLRYHGVSIAKTYNQIWQLLFSGSSDLITDKQRRYLRPYALV